MEIYINQISVFTAAITMGGMLFFAFFMAPLIFIKLSPKTAGNFIREVFPWYYLVFAVLSMALGMFLLINGNLLLVLLAAFCLIGFVYARQILMPKINSSRDAGNEKRFNFLHRVSVVINSMQLLAVLIVFYSLIK